MRLLRQRGFSLSEVLIALALLGVIAAFTIPKILQAQQTTSDDSKLKETYSALSDVLYQGILEKKIDPQYGASASPADYLFSHLNTIKQASSQCITNGIMAAGSPDVCWGDTWNNNVNWGGVVFGSGVSVCGFTDNYCPSCLTNGITSNPNQFGNSLLMDANGLTGPNQIGVDRLMISISVGTEPLESVNFARPILPGTIAVATSSTRPECIPLVQQNQALFQRISS